MINKVALINGACGGMGRQIAEDLLKNNYSVVLLGRSHQKLLVLKNTLSDFLEGENFINVLQNDLLDHGNDKSVYNWLVSSNIIPSLFVNCCGAVKLGTLHEVDDDDWFELININLLGVIKLTREVSRLMIDNSRRGHIILINGVLSKQPKPNLIINSTITGGVANFCKALSKDIASKQVRVNVINPGLTKTELFEDMKLKISKKYNITVEDVELDAIRSSPIGKIMTVKDISNTVLFLDSLCAENINGASITIDGGSSEC